jgi:hypothetical protein
MGTSAIATGLDVTQIGADVTELNNKLNLLVIEYNKVSADTTANKNLINTLLGHMATNTTAINALKTQFNNAESDLTNHKGKIDTLISDVTATKTKISGTSYSPTTSGQSNAYGQSTDNILLRLERLDIDFAGLDSRFGLHLATASTSLNGILAAHNTSSGTGRTAANPHLNGISSLSTGSGGSAADTSSAVSNTAVTTSGSAVDTSIGAAPASVVGTYSSENAKVITIGDKSETRARQLARKSLNSLRN